MALPRWRDILWHQKLYLHKKTASCKMSSFHEKLFLSPSFTSTVFLICKVGLIAVSSLIRLLWEFRQKQVTHIHTNPLRIHCTQKFLFHTDESILIEKPLSVISKDSWKVKVSVDRIWANVFFFFKFCSSNYRLATLLSVNTKILESIFLYFFWLWGLWGS